MDEVVIYQTEDGSTVSDLRNETDDIFEDFIRDQKPLEEVDEPPEFAQFRKDRAWKLDGRKYSDKQIKLFKALGEFNEMPETNVFEAYKKLRKAWYFVHTYRMQKLFGELKYKDKWVDAGLLSPWPAVNGYWYDKDKSNAFLEHLRETNPDFMKF